jgi:hypothetical protein
MNWACYVETQVSRCSSNNADSYVLLPTDGSVVAVAVLSPLSKQYGSRE